MKKTANLKKRFDELRNEPELSVEVVLQLDADLHRTLKKFAAEERLSLEIYIINVLRNNNETDADGKSGEGGIEILA